MRLVVFGLTISACSGNRHARLWRGLVSGLMAAGHRVTFFERARADDAERRDLSGLPDGAAVIRFHDFADVAGRARRALAASDVGIVTSCCPDALAATQLLQESRGIVRCFYDLDTPVTLARDAHGERVDYLGPDGLAPFDLVLSYTGGPALSGLRERLGARRVVPLYGCVDPARYRPAPPRVDVGGLLTYLGSYAEDRQAMLERLLVAPAGRLPDERFVIGGAHDPSRFAWTDNIRFLGHVPPADHPSFYASGRLTLNVTRAAMRATGWCPSGRLFEAAACGVPILSDSWPGLDAFFVPDEEILVADTTEQALAALAAPPHRLASIAKRARDRTLEEHTAARRVEQLVAALDGADVPVAA